MNGSFPSTLCFSTIATASVVKRPLVAITKVRTTGGSQSDSAAKVFVMSAGATDLGLFVDLVGIR